MSNKYSKCLRKNKRAYDRTTMAMSGAPLGGPTSRHVNVTRLKSYLQVDLRKRAYTKSRPPFKYIYLETCGPLLWVIFFVA